MENNKFEKVIFTLLKVFGVLSIIGGYLEMDGVFYKQKLIVLGDKTILGNIYMISPIILVKMIVTIIVYLILIKILAKHIRITKKSV